jgi:threonine synthase
MENIVPNGTNHHIALAQPTYHSTRSQYPILPFSEALLAGLAPDGGLYIPDRIPRLDASWQTASSFPDLAFSVLQQWIGNEVPADI